LRCLRAAQMYLAGQLWPQGRVLEIHVLKCRRNWLLRSGMKPQFLAFGAKRGVFTISSINHSVWLILKSIISHQELYQMHSFLHDLFFSVKTWRIRKTPNDFVRSLMTSYDIFHNTVKLIYIDLCETTHFLKVTSEHLTSQINCNCNEQTFPAQHCSL
jgi:hypothetical protein